MSSSGDIMLQVKYLQAFTRTCSLCKIKQTQLNIQMFQVDFAGPMPLIDSSASLYTL